MRAWRVLLLIDERNQPMTQHERDTLVLSLLDHVTPLLHHYAAKYRQLLNYDDLYQDASIHIMRLIDAGTSLQDLERFSYNRVKSRIIDKVKYLTRRLAQSLDAPIYNQEGTATFGDLLPSPYCVEPLAVLLAQEDIQALLPRVATLPRGRVALAQELGATVLASL
jgi:DNA-directed RNA polymerase specialized sigma24 family protein